MNVGFVFPTWRRAITNILEAEVFPAYLLSEKLFYFTSNPTNAGLENVGIKTIKMNLLGVNLKNCHMLLKEAKKDKKSFVRPKPVKFIGEKNPRLVAKLVGDKDVFEVLINKALKPLR